MRAANCAVASTRQEIEMSTMALGYQTAAQASCGGSCARLWSQFVLWRQRTRQRHQLAALSDRQLDDIGISREQADCEAAKPFWQA